MLPDRFWVFYKKTFIKKIMLKRNQKVKLVKYGVCNTLVDIT